MTTGMFRADTALPDGRIVAGEMVRYRSDDKQSEEAGRPIHLCPLDGTHPELLYAAWELPAEAEDEDSLGGSPG